MTSATLSAARRLALVATLALLHQAAFQPLVLRAGVVDTVRLRLKYDDRFVIWDCIGPVKPDNTQGFGPEFCRP